VTTKRQINRLVRPLLERHTDLAFVKNIDGADILVVRPVHYLLRFVLVDRTREAARFSPKWILRHLLARSERLSWRVEGDLRPRKAQLWYWSDPDIVREFTEAVEKDALPRLRAIKTLQDYLDFALPSEFPGAEHYWNDQALCGAALGDLDLVRHHLIENPHLLFLQSLKERDAGLSERLRERGARLTTTDRATLAKILHERHRYTVGKLNLCGIWEPTPFPLELETVRS
jgi:hypothetical protein